MPIPKPTSEELARIAQRLGFRTDDAAMEGYSALVSALLDGYDAVDTVEDTPVLATRERVESQFPTAEEDPTTPGTSAPRSGVRRRGRWPVRGWR